MWRLLLTHCTPEEFNAGCAYFTEMLRTEARELINSFATEN